jgi:hypothetical protein
MARGRFITATLGSSHKLASVKDDAHRLMFVLMVANADVEGRLDADPRILNGRVFTLLGWDLDRVETGLQALADADLIRWYEVDGRPYAEIVKFHEHNSVRKDREQASHIKAATEGKPIRLKGDAGALREDAGSTPAQEKLSQAKTKTRVREELSSASPTRADKHQELAEIWNYHRGVLPECEVINDTRARGFDRLIKDFGDDAPARMAAATQNVAADAYWQQQNYNIDNLLKTGRVLEKSDKWKANAGMTAGDRKLATTAATIARAIGGLDA